MASQVQAQAADYRCKGIQNRKNERPQEGYGNEDTNHGDKKSFHESISARAAGFRVLRLYAVHGPVWRRPNPRAPTA